MDNKSEHVRKLFQAIKKGNTEEARAVLREAPYLVHARSGRFETETPLLTAVLAGDKAMTRMLLDEGSPAFSIEGDQRARIPIEQALRGGATGMLEVFVEHAGGIEALVDSSISEGKLSLLLTSLAGGAMPTRLHEDLLLAALEPVGRSSWPSRSPFASIEWPWSDAYNWADPSDGFISKLEEATDAMPSSTAKMSEFIVGPYAADQAWLNTMANLVTSRDNKFSRRWLAQTPDALWIEPMPDRPSMNGPQQAFAETLVELCARKGHLHGLKIGLDAIERMGNLAWIQSNQAKMFMAAAGPGQIGGTHPSLAAIRMLDKRIGMDGLGASSRKTIVELLVADDYEPRLRAKAIMIFLQGRETIPDTDALLNITKWSTKATKHVATIVLAMADNGLDLQQETEGGVTIWGHLAQSHPKAAAMVSHSMMSNTSTPEHEARPKRRM